DDRLRHLDLSIVEVEEGAVLVDGRGSDNGIVDFELADEINRSFAYHTTIQMPHDPTGYYHLDLFASLQYIDNINIICDREEPSLAAQSDGDLLCRCSYVDQKRRIVGNEGSRCAADPPLL